MVKDLTEYGEGRYRVKMQIMYTKQKGKKLFWEPSMQATKTFSVRSTNNLEDRASRYAEKIVKAKGEEYFFSGVYPLKVTKLAVKDPQLETVNVKQLKLFKGSLTHASCLVQLKNRSKNPEISKYMQLSIGTANVIARFVYNDIIQRFPAPAGGIQRWVKIVLANEDDLKNLSEGSNIPSKSTFSKVFSDRSHTFTVPKIAGVLHSMSGHHFDTMDYTLSFFGYEIVNYKLPEVGGCSETNKCTRKIKDKVGKEFDKVKFTDTKSTNNNCAFTCLNKVYQLTGNRCKPDTVRKKLNIELKTKINFNQLPEIIEYYNELTKQDYGWMIMNANEEMLLINKKEHNVQMALIDEHYVLYEYKIHTKCKECGNAIINMNNHTCNNLRVNYYYRKMKQKKIVQVRDNKEKTKLNYNTDVCFWDCETFQPKDGYAHVPYASAWSYGEDETYEKVYGNNSLQLTLDAFLKMKNTTIVAFNGSRFDFYFLINALISRGEEIDNKTFIISNGRLMGFKFGQNNKIFDLCLFITTSLKKALKDFNTVWRKTEFDHTLIQCWEDTEKYRPDIEPYLKNDVMALRELFIKFNDIIYNKFQVNVTSYVTLSHMSYILWTNMFKGVVSIPDSMEKYYHCKAATFGGRTYPHQKTFTSKNYEKIVSGDETYDQVMKSGDFLYNADASSLYPASMSGTDFMKVRYPVGMERWSDTPKEEYDKGLLGFYAIDFIPPKDITYPVLPRKRMLNGKAVGCEWSLLPGSGVYTSVDIANAISCKYSVIFKNRCLVWDQSSDSLFTEYVDTMYEMKKESEKESNQALRAVAKLMMNSLFGKTLQRAILNKNTICKDVYQFLKFEKDHELTSWTYLSDTALLVSGTARDAPEQITKPCQIGAFITAYSRSIMLHYVKAANPSLKKVVFTYTDTDSLHLTSKAYFKLKKLNYILSKAEVKIGYLCSDIDNEGLIIKEDNIAPKCYIYEHIDCKNDLYIGKQKCVMKCKGIPKSLLEPEFFNDGQQHSVKWDGLKKYSVSVPSTKAKDGVSNFNIVNQQYKRMFNKTSWTGFDFYGNLWLPKGYDGPLKKT